MQRMPPALPPPADWLAAATVLLAPPACAACRAPLPRAAEPLCAPCRAALPWLRVARCPRCALPLPCGRRCPMAGAALARAWTPMAYEGPARDLVHALKLRGALRLIDVMAAQMVATAPPGLLAPGCVLVPVPAAALRRRRRGFDHAGRLAAAVGVRAGLDVEFCLRRVGRAPRQARAPRATRMKRGRVRVAVSGAPPPRVVLVDDVLTTGATMRACAAALVSEGTKLVSALAYARALR